MTLQQLRSGLRACGVLMAAFAVVCAVIVIAGHITALRAVGAIPLVFVLPGAALCAAMPPRLRRTLPKLVAVPALSVSLTILTALVLAALHGYHAASLAVLLATIVLVLGASSLRGRDSSRDTERMQVRVRIVRRTALPIMATFLVVAAVVAAVVWASVDSAHRDNAKARTVAVWATPVSGGYDVGLNGDSSVSGLNVEVRAGSSIVGRWTDVSLPGGQWTQFLPRVSSARPLTVLVVENGTVLRSLVTP